MWLGVCVGTYGCVGGYLLVENLRNAEPMELQLKLISCFYTLSCGGDQIVTAVYLP